MSETSVKVVIYQNQYLCTQSRVHCQGKCTTMSSIPVHFQDKCTIKRVSQPERLTMRRTASHCRDRDRDTGSQYWRAVSTPRQMENFETKDFYHCQGTTERNIRRSCGWGEPGKTILLYILTSLPPCVRTRTMTNPRKKRTNHQVGFEEEDVSQTIEISNDGIKKKKGFEVFLTKLKMFVLKRSKYDMQVQTLVWLRR